MRIWLFVGLMALAWGDFATAQNYPEAPAAPGQTCKTMEETCTKFCLEKNLSTSCGGICTERYRYCTETGRWPIDTQKEMLTGLPPR